MLVIKEIFRMDNTMGMGFTSIQMETNIMECTKMVKNMDTVDFI
jgi:hypothetical protein